MGCGASSAASVAVPESAAAQPGQAARSPAATPPTSAGTDGEDDSSQMPLPPGGVDLRSSIEGSVTQPPPAKSPEVVMTVWDDGAAGPVRAAPDTSALFDAVRAGDVEPILDHIQSGGELGVFDDTGNTLLHWGVLTAKPTLVSTLIDHGVDTNIANDQGVTPLFYAAMMGDGSVVGLLVNQGARVNLQSVPKSSTGADAWHTVKAHKHLLSSLELEEEIKLCSSPVHAATVQGHFRVVLFLVQHGADVNLPAREGSTALHFACKKGYIGLASFLIESGADPLTQNDAGLVPADVADGDFVKDLLIDTEGTPNSAEPSGSSSPAKGGDGGTPQRRALTFNDSTEIVVMSNAPGITQAATTTESWFKPGPGPWVFGKLFLDNFGAKEWKTRMGALRSLVDELGAVRGETELIYGSVCAVFGLACADKVAQVYLLALELLRKAVTIFAAQLSEQEMRDPMKALLLQVVAYTGKSQEKVRNESFKVVLFAARNPALGPKLVAELVLAKPAKKESVKKWRPAYGRLKILAQMVFEFKFGEHTGLNLSAVMDAAIPAFENPNEQVRKAAVDLFVEAYMLEGAAADGYVEGLKPSQQQMIRAELASIDAPTAPPVAERPPPTASRLTDDTATSRPVTAGAAGRPGTSSIAAAGVGEGSGAEAMPYAAPIAADKAEQSAHIVRFFGDEVARCFVAPGWQSRVAALQKIQAMLTQLGGDAADEEMDLTQSEELAAGVGLSPKPASAADDAAAPPGLADAAYRVVFTALHDKVAHVYTAALGCLLALAQAKLGTLATQDPGAEVLRDRIVRAVVCKLGARNARIRARTEQLLTELARCNRVGRVDNGFDVAQVAFHVMDTSQPSSSTSKGKAPRDQRMTEPRLKLLTILIQENGLGTADEGALSLEKVMGCTVPAFENRDKKVRKAAVGVYVACWGRVGSDALQPHVAHLKESMRKVLKEKTEGKATTADGAGADGVEDGGIVFFNADEFKAPTSSADSGGGGGGDDDSTKAGALPYASALSPDMAEAVAPLAEAFGNDTMQCFFSKQWAPREAALRRVESLLRARSSQECERRVFTYAVFMLESALADKIAGVLWGGLSLLRTLVASYARDLAPVEVHYSLEKLLPLILAQLGSSNKRTAQGCEQTIQFLSWRPNVGCAFIARHILAHEHKKNVRGLEMKLLMLAQLVNDFGISDESGIDADTLFACAAPSFEHRSAAVRKAAAAVYVNAHKFIGAEASDLLTTHMGGVVKTALRASLAQAVCDAPHGGGERPKTPAAFIFDRPSTAAERLAQSGGWQQGVKLEAAPILAQAGIAVGTGGGQGYGDDASGPQVDEGVEESPQSTQVVGKVSGVDVTEEELNAAVATEIGQLSGNERTVAHITKLFGEDLLLAFRDPSSSVREEALEGMQDVLWSNGPLLGSAEEAAASLEACLDLVKRALADSAMAVQSAGLEMLKTLVVTHNRKLGAFELRLALGSVATSILNLSSDGPVRIRPRADEMALFLCHQPKIGVPFMSRYLLEAANAPHLQSRKDKGRAVVLARLKLLGEMLAEAPDTAGNGLGEAGGTWSVESVATFVAGCICYHKSPAVRTKARHLALVLCQRDDGSCAVERLVQNPPTADEEPRNRVVEVLRGTLAEYRSNASASAAPPSAALDAARAQSAATQQRSTVADTRPATFGGEQLPPLSSSADGDASWAPSPSGGLRLGLPVNIGTTAEFAGRYDDDPGLGGMSPLASTRSSPRAGRRANSGTTAPPEQPRLSTPEASMGPMLDGYMPPLKPRDPPQLSAKRRTRRRKEGSD